MEKETGESSKVTPLRRGKVTNGTSAEQLGQPESIENDSRLSGITIETLLSSTVSEPPLGLTPFTSAAETDCTLSQYATAQLRVKSTVQQERAVTVGRSDGNLNGVYPFVEDKSQTGPKRPPGLRSNGEDCVKIWRRVELVLLGVSIMVVCGLLFLPVVFYYLPREEVDSFGCMAYSISDSTTQVCQDVIRSLHGTCLPGSGSLNTTDVYISPRGRTQQELEDVLTIGLGVVQPSPECEEVIVPFLCLYYLRLCDGGGEVTYHPSVEDCVAVSTEICPREWAQADSLLEEIGESLPSCEALGNEESLQCDYIGNSEMPSNATGMAGDSSGKNGSGSSTESGFDSSGESGSDSTGESGSDLSGKSGFGSSGESESASSGGSGFGSSESGSSGGSGFGSSGESESGSSGRSESGSSGESESGSSGGSGSDKGEQAYQPETTSVTVTDTENASRAEMCAVYTGSVCSDQLLRLQKCLPGKEGSQLVYISADINQTVVEDEVISINKGLGNPLLSPSAECLDAVDPFLCLYYFGLCDSSGSLFEPSAETCVAISTDICQREWSIASAITTLPSCEMLGEQLLTCSGTGLAGSVSDMPASGSCPQECRDGFYCASGLCRPRCDTWKETPQSEIIAMDVAIILSALIGLFSGIAVLVVSCIRWKRVFVLPSIIIVYKTISVLVLAIFVLVLFMDRNDLFCTTLDLRDSVDNPTAFCIINGAVFYYVLLQLAVWWLLHVLILFWKIHFPLHSRGSGASRRLRYIHIAVVVSGLLVPWIPVITAFATGGFNNILFPPYLCTGRDADATFYSLVVPIMIVLQVGVTLLIMIFWTLHKQVGLFSLKRSKVPTAMRMGTPEKKILVMLCYYILLGVIALVAFNHFLTNSDTVAREYGKYFICESKGIDPDNPEECDRSGFEQYKLTGLTATGIVLIGIYPAVHLIFIVNIKELKQFFSRLNRIKAKWLK